MNFKKHVLEPESQACVWNIKQIKSQFEADGMVRTNMFVATGLEVMFYIIHQPENELLWMEQIKVILST